MIVILDRERLESPLIEMPRSQRVMMGVPTHGVCLRHPSQELGELAILVWPHYKMPVIGHQTIGEYIERDPLAGLGQDGLERFVVGGFSEEWRPSDRTV
jgi:hypothetical protein